MDHWNQPMYSCPRETKDLTTEILSRKKFWSQRLKDQSIFADIITRKRWRSCLGFERWSEPRISFQHTSTICLKSTSTICCSKQTLSAAATQLKTFWEFSKHLFSMFSLLPLSCCKTSLQLLVTSRLSMGWSNGKGKTKLETDRTRVIGSQITALHVW